MDGQQGKINYQRELDHILSGFSREGRVPRLLLHACCAPCSSYVLEYLSAYFQITVFFYNPNIGPRAEYEKRAEEIGRLISCLPVENRARLELGAYEPERFLAAVRGLEQEPEGGRRCEACFRLRLEEAAALAALGGYDYFCTTLTISPLKDAALLNRIGLELGRQYGVAYLPSDFKKREGYKRSIQLSQAYGLYRQDYCGCVYSKLQREQEKRAKAQEES